jgi:hypothetical protein
VRLASPQVPESRDLEFVDFATDDAEAGDTYDDGDFDEGDELSVTIDGTVIAHIDQRHSGPPGPVAPR